MPTNPPSPTFTVIIPAHNLEDYIQSAVSSVLNQHGEPAQLVVVCDGCTDGTADVVRRLDVTPHVVDAGGAGPARNEGLERAEGDYILFLDGDDYLRRSDSLQLLASRLRDEYLDALTFDFMWGRQRYAGLLPDGQRVPMVWPRAWRRDSISDLRFGDMTPGQDYDFNQRFFATPRRHARLTACLLQYVTPRPGSTMSTWTRSIHMLGHFRTYGAHLASTAAPPSTHPEGAHLPYRFVTAMGAGPHDPQAIRTALHTFQELFGPDDPSVQFVLLDGSPLTTMAGLASDDVDRASKTSNIVIEPWIAASSLQYDARLLLFHGSGRYREDSLEDFIVAMAQVKKHLDDMQEGPPPGFWRTDVAQADSRLLGSTLRDLTNMEDRRLAPGPAGTSR